LVVFRILVQFLALTLLAIVGSAVGYGQESEASDPRRAFTLLDQAPRQQLPLENDRFRIDYEIDEIILVFFRKPDTAPVVLTLPDGSKWYASRHPREKARWHSGHDFDMVRIVEPMPGPWQATGEIRPESRAMVYTDVEFHPESFPPLVFVGERLRMEGRLTQGGEPIDQLDFRSAIRLELYMASTNNAQYDNFGQPPVLIGEFLDDGRRMDERPRDGVFTGEFMLEIAAGEYLPTYRVETPFHRRSVEADVMMVRRVPVRPVMEVSQEEGDPHIMRFEVDDEFIMRDDIVVSGRIDFPNGEHQNISLSTRQGDALRVEIPSYTFGVFEVQMALSGTNVNGREFHAEIPAFDFRSQRARDLGPTPEEIAAAEAAERERIHQAELAQVEAERERMRQRILWVVGVNLGIVALWSLYILIRPGSGRKKLKAAKKAQKKNEQSDGLDEL